MIYNILEVLIYSILIILQLMKNAIPLQPRLLVYIVPDQHVSLIHQAFSAYFLLT